MSCQPEPRLVCSVFICIKRNKATTARKAKPENPEWQSTNYWVISLLLHPALIYCLLGIFIESYKRQLQLFLQAKFNPTYLLSCERVIYLLCSSASSICSDSPDPYWLTKAHIVGATISPYLSVITEGAAMGTERKQSHLLWMWLRGYRWRNAYESPGSAHHTASGTSPSRKVSWETTSHCWYSSHGLTAVWVVHLVVSHHEWAEAPLYDSLEEKGGRDILWERMVGQQARRQCLLIW